MVRRPLTQRLPDFPWDSLAGAKTTAAAHPDGLVDLSIGTPVDPIAVNIQDALAAAAADPGYPPALGTAALREACADALTRRYACEGVTADSIVPVIGTKESIAWLPTMLGLGPGDLVVIPETAYPTYEVAARIAGCDVLRADSLFQIGPQKPALLFLNSPSNPTGKVLGQPHLEKVVSWAQERGVIVAADECYLGLDWSDTAVSILHPSVSRGDHTGLLAIHSLSKTSNMASYRTGFFAGDQQLIAELSEVRRNAGMMIPGPIQAAMQVALADDAQEAEQKQRYARRRDLLIAAATSAGLHIDESAAGLYLWASRDDDCWDTVNWFADRGILVAPGTFYGPQGGQHVRISLTASDADIEKAAQRLRG